MYLRLDWLACDSRYKVCFTALMYYVTYYFNHSFSDPIYQVKCGFESCEMECKKPHHLDHIIHSGKAKNLCTNVISKQVINLIQSSYFIT